MEGYIYKITNSLTNQVYIGQAINLKRRIYRYKMLDCINQKLIYQSLKKYGWEEHRLEILEVADIELLDELETKYIELHNSCWYKNPELGLNLLAVHSTRKGVPHSSETKSKLSAYFKGRKLSDETKKKMSEVRKGKMQNVVRVYQFKKTGELVQEYSSITEASAVTNINSTSIWRCIHNHMNTAGGFRWSTFNEINKSYTGISRLSSEEVKKIRNDYKNSNLSIRAYSKLINIKYNTVYHILNNKTHKHVL